MLHKLINLGTSSHKTMSLTQRRHTTANHSPNNAYHSFMKVKSEKKLHSFRYLKMPKAFDTMTESDEVDELHRPRKHTSLTPMMVRQNLKTDRIMRKAEKEASSIKEIKLLSKSPHRSNKGASDDLPGMLKDTNIKIRKAMNSLKWITGEDIAEELKPRNVTAIELFEDISVYYKIPVQNQKGSCVVKFNYLSEGEI